jgi:antitoxin CcdA
MDAVHGSLLLIEKVREARNRQWREENRESIAAYNQHVDKHGVFSDDSRSF